MLQVTASDGSDLGLVVPHPGGAGFGDWAWAQVVHAECPAIASVMIARSSTVLSISPEGRGQLQSVLA